MSGFHLEENLSGEVKQLPGWTLWVYDVETLRPIGNISVHCDRRGGEICKTQVRAGHFVRFQPSGNSTWTATSLPHTFRLVPFKNMDELKEDCLRFLSQKKQPKTKQTRKNTSLNRNFLRFMQNLNVLG